MGAMFRMTEEQIATHNARRANERVAELAVSKRHAKKIAAEVAAWMAAHPNATRKELNEAVQEIQRRIRGSTRKG